MYSIQEVCEKTGLTAHTLRYYEKEGLLTAVNRHQAVLLRNYIHQEDPAAFLIITTSTEIIGKGFRGVN